MVELEREVGGARREEETVGEENGDVEFAAGRLEAAYQEDAGCDEEDGVGPCTRTYIHARNQTISDLCLQPSREGEGGEGAIVPHNTASQAKPTSAAMSLESMVSRTGAGKVGEARRGLDEDVGQHLL